jgi:hypothetical protein
MIPETISPELFQGVVSAIQRLCDKASLQENSKMILTEADLQSWIFCYLHSYLVGDTVIGGATDNGGFGVHSQTSFLDDERKLRIKPDLVIIAKQEYSVSPDSSDSLCWRKGYSAWGSSIPIELKILRTCYNPKNEYRKWQKDINKLHLIKSIHYSDPPENAYKCFPLFVLFCRQELSEDLSDKLKRYAISKSIDLIISIFGCAPSCYQACV